jgi:hypothetical protein
MVPPSKGRAALITATTEMRHRLAALVSELDAIRGRGGLDVAQGEGAR